MTPRCRSHFLEPLARILVAGQAADEAVAAPRWTFDRTTLLLEIGLALPAPPGMTVDRLRVPEVAGHAHVIRVPPDGPMRDATRAPTALPSVTERRLRAAG